MKQQITPYITFNSNAKEALEYYKSVFEGEIQGIQTFGDAEFPTPPERDNRIMHARFKKDGLFFMVSDAFLGQSVEVGNHISLALESKKELYLWNYKIHSGEQNLRK